MIAIIGAGLAGLSCACRLNELGRDYIVLERSQTPGGLCVSYKKNGYTFDLAGHFLHLKTRKCKRFARKTVKSPMAVHSRKASIRTHGVKVPFPFQAHLGALPKAANLECITGYVKILTDRNKAKSDRFDKWVLHNFGAGMAKHFFFPYNEKFFKRDLGKILVDWTTWSVPRPNPEEVLRGALGMKNEGMGYNPQFLYPLRGGIGALVKNLANLCNNLQTDATVESIDTSSKKLTLADGRQIKYSRLVSTMPLPKLVQMIEGMDPRIKRSASKLSWLAVDCVQLGINRADVLGDHWAYVPEKKYSFYRAGTYPTQKRKTSMFVEFTRRHTDPLPAGKRLINQALKGLKSLGIITGNDKIEESHVVTLDPAYVLYDRHRRDNLPKITAALKRRGILSIGRYGAWEYSAMEDAILQGLEAAESL